MEKSKLIDQAIKLDLEIHEYVKQQSFQAWMHLSLTIPQLKTLLYVSSKGGTNPGKLAIALNVTPANVTGIVDRLVEQGLLSRQETPEDRRTLTLRTTERGEAILSSLRERRSSTLRQALITMSEANLKSLIEGLSSLAESAKVIQNASEEDPDLKDVAEAGAGAVTAPYAS